MDDRELTMREFVWKNLPKTFKELVVYWVWVHSLLVARFTRWRKPYKSGYLSIKEVSRGYYVGYKASMTLGTGIWLSMSTAMIGLFILILG